MKVKVLISAILASMLAVTGCSDDSSPTGSGGTAGSAGSAGEGGAGGGTSGVCDTGFGGFPAADCENLPDLTAYVVGDFYDSVPATADDDCDVLFEGSDTNSADLNVLLNNADIGAIICIAEGTYAMEATLTVAIPGLTLKGIGDSPDKTVLNFGGPGSGKGILVQQNDVTIENMWIKNTGDNSVQQEAVTGSVFRKLHVSWDINGENMSLNGAYALYPTDCDQTLVEYNQLQGASDAGIYVGKCGWGDDATDGGIVRYNVVHENVLGLEVENSLDVVVHDNTMVNNTAGLLSLTQPISAEKPTNRNIIWYDNNSYCNNHPNFAATGVAQIAPPGSGAIVYSGDGQELCNNRFQNNVTGGILIISNYFICQIAPPTDCNRPDGYVPYPQNIYTHDNYFDGNGENVQGDFAPFFAALGIGTPENPVEDVFWDGYIYPEAPGGDPSICLGANNTASYRDATNNQCQDVDCEGVNPSVCEALITSCAVQNMTTDTAGRLCDAPL
jgi:parallel beta-helix repeat protein